MTFRSSATALAVVTIIVTVLSPAAVAGVADIAQSSPDANYLEPVGIGAIVIAIVGAVIKVVPQVMALLTRAGLLLERIEQKLDADEKRNAELFTKILFREADKHGETTPAE